MNLATLDIPSRSMLNLSLIINFANNCFFNLPDTLVTDLGEKGPRPETGKRSAKK